jgi:DedD protein
MCWRQLKAAADAWCTNRGFNVSDFIDFTVSDAELEIKKRARRRLVGASVLALLAAIALPLALKNSDEPRAVPDMHVSIPEGGDFELPQAGVESDSGLAFESESESESESGSELAEALIEPDVASGAPESSVAVVNAPLSSPEPSPPLASAPPERPAPPPAAARPPEEPRQKNRPPRQGDVEKDAEVARVTALLDAKTPAKEADKGAAKTQGQTFIQVSAFSNADRAAKQAKELNDKGFAAYTEKAGKVTRVRIGPLPKSEGEQMLARLKAQGHNPVLSSR